MHVCIQDGDGLWKETVCPGSGTPVASARGQQVKQVVGGDVSSGGVTYLRHFGSE